MPLAGTHGHRLPPARAARAAVACAVSSALLAGCVPASDGTGALVSSSTPQRVVMQIVNNACGESGEDSESLATGSVKGLSKVLSGFGIPYDEHADAFSVMPKPVTDSSDAANKERGVGYMGIESHMPQELAAGQTHSTDHPDVGTEPGDTFPNLTTEEEKYGISMRWEYYKQDNTGHGLDGYSAFMRLGASEGKQYVAVHNLVTDKWVICCPYDWGPDLRLPTTSGTKYSGGRIGGVAPQAAEDLGISGGDGPADSMCECWWVENSSQVKCGPVSDLSALTGSPSPSSGNSAQVALVAPAAVSSVVGRLAGASGSVGSSDDSLSVSPSNPNSFADARREEWEHGELPTDKVRYIVLHDTDVYAMDAREVMDAIDRLSIPTVPHFIVDRDGTITYCVDMGSIARHAGASSDDGANESFSIIQERDDERGLSEAALSADHAMDAWSIGIALVHDQDDGSYPNVQLNALDRLVAYIDQEIGHQPRIITQADWEGTKVRIDLDTEAATEAYVAAQDPTDHDDGTIPAASLVPLLEPADEQLMVAAMSSVTDAFPARSYDETRNHAGVRTQADALAASQSGGCSDGDSSRDSSDDGGAATGDAIARKAVELSGSPQATDPVAAAVTGSGADASFPTDGGASRQASYLSSGAKWTMVSSLRVGDAPDPLCKPGDVLVASDGSHSIIYVGSAAVRTRYPDSSANVYDDAKERGVGECWRLDAIVGAVSYDVFRIVRSDVGDDAEESLREARRRISNLRSKTEFMCAVDYDRGFLHVFRGEKGKWELERSCRTRNGQRRYFGNENKRTVMTTPIGLFALWSEKRAIGPSECCFTVANNHACDTSTGKRLISTNSFTHAYITPAIYEGCGDYHTWGVDLAERAIRRGKIHVGAGCVTPMREDAIWFYETVATGDATWYVWTEEPANENDRFENEELKEIMISNGYSDIAQLKPSERSVTTLNHIDWEEDWTWEDVDAAFNGKAVSEASSGTINVDVTRA